MGRPDGPSAPTPRPRAGLASGADVGRGSGRWPGRTRQHTLVPGGGRKAPAGIQSPPVLEHRRDDTQAGKRPGTVQGHCSSPRRIVEGHLQAYVDEAAFRFNVRDLSEWDRFDRAMRQITGKRLTYSDLTGGATR